MTRADGGITNVHYKGKDDDFIVITEGIEAVRRWKKDKSIPLVDVVNSFDIFVTHKHGTQGTLDRASNALLENEFDTKDSTEIITKILEEGDVRETKASARQGDRNPTNGPGISNLNPVHQ